jgi:hypothetical protein
VVGPPWNTEALGRWPDIVCWRQGRRKAGFLQGSPCSHIDYMPPWTTVEAGVEGNSFPSSPGRSFVWTYTQPHTASQHFKDSWQRFSY